MIHHAELSADKENNFIKIINYINPPNEVGKKDRSLDPSLKDEFLEYSVLHYAIEHNGVSPAVAEKRLEELALRFKIINVDLESFKKSFELFPECKPPES
jgi:hypothetical protein